MDHLELVEFIDRLRISEDVVDHDDLLFATRQYFWIL